MNFVPAFLNLQRQQADSDADALVQAIFQEGTQTSLYAVLSMPVSDYENLDNIPLKQFLMQSLPKPDWFKPELLKKGQRVFEKYALPIMTLLGGLSLPYCYAASPGNKALYLSEKMRKNQGKRLADTADFIIAVSSPGQLDENSDGHFHINKTRLIHAIARYYILKGKDWDMAWGLPINQEDMAGTNLAFSFLILRGLKKAGYTITEREMESFTSLWRYIGYQLHISTELLPANYAEAMVLERTIRNRHFKKSEEGIALTKELLAYYKSMIPEKESVYIDAQVRYWLGKSVADCVGLEANPANDRKVEALNLVQEATNFLKIKEGDFAKMLQNHATIKAKVA